MENWVRGLHLVDWIHGHMELYPLYIYPNIAPRIDIVYMYTIVPSFLRREFPSRERSQPNSVSSIIT